MITLYTRTYFGLSGVGTEFGCMIEMNASLRRYKVHTAVKCDYVVSYNMTTALRRLCENSNTIFGWECRGGLLVY